MAKKINLNDYLGHSMDCTCGKEHKTNLKAEKNIRQILKL